MCKEMNNWKLLAGISLVILGTSALGITMTFVVHATFYIKWITYIAVSLLVLGAMFLQEYDDKRRNKEN